MEERYIYKIEWEDKEVFVNKETLMRILGNFGWDMEELDPKEIQIKELEYFI